MTLEEKKEVIIKNKDPVMAALESVSDRIYDLTDDLLDNSGQLMNEKIGNESAYDFFKTLRKDSIKYESIREKLLSGDFNLSPTEIAHIGLAFFFCAEKLAGQQKNLKLAEEMCRDLTKQLLLSSTEEVQI